MAVASHYAAALVKSRRPGIRWVAEFSDPLQVNADGRGARRRRDRRLAQRRAVHGDARRGFRPPRNRRVFGWSERLVYALADEIVFTNPHQRDLMLGYCEDPRAGRAGTLGSPGAHHPVLPGAYYELAARGPRLPAPARAPCVLRRLLRDPRPRRRGLGPAAAASGRARAACLHVYTAEPESSRWRSRARGSREGRVAPYVPVLEFLNLTTPSTSWSSTTRDRLAPRRESLPALEAGRLRRQRHPGVGDL